MRIGVLGGSFDPPHLGHLAVASAVESGADLDLVLFVPANHQWQKQHDASADIRAHMVGLAIASHSRWQLSLVDIERPKPTFTVDTLHDLANAWPDAELCFVVGADAAAGLDGWHEANVLREEAQFLVVGRPGMDIQVPAGFRYTVIPAETPAISSTEVREIAGRPDITVEELGEVVPEAVARFIVMSRVYA